MKAWVSGFHKTVIVTIAAFMVIACTAVVRAQTAPKLGAVTVGTVKATANLLAFVAPERAPQYGLDAKTIEFRNSNDCQTAMINGQIDFCVLTPVHLLRAVDTGLNLVQIAGESRGNSAVVLAKPLSIGKDDWTALKAQNAKKKMRVVVSPGSVTEMLAVAEFAQNGIDIDRDMEVVNMPNFGQHPQALRSGEFDMALTLDPLATLIAAQGVGTIFNYPYDTPAKDLCTTWVVTSEWLAKNRDKARVFVHMLVDASKWLNSDKTALLEKSRQYIGLSDEILQKSFSNNRFDVTNGLLETTALAKIAAQRKYTSQNVAPELPKAIDDSLLKEFGADK